MIPAVCVNDSYFSRVLFLGEFSPTLCLSPLSLEVVMDLHNSCIWADVDECNLISEGLGD